MLAALLQPFGVCATYLNPEVAGVSNFFLFTKSYSGDFHWSIPEGFIVNCSLACWFLLDSTCKTIHSIKCGLVGFVLVLENSTCKGHSFKFDVNAGMAEWLGRSTLVLRVEGSSYSPDLLQKVWGEYLPTLCNSRQSGKRNHEVWSHRKEGPGSHCLD